MGIILPRRFEPIRVLRKDKASSTLVATDQHLGRNEVVVKVIGKGSFTADTASLIETFSWHRGLRHAFFSEVLDAGFTPKRDLFYVRAYHPDSEFFNSAKRESVKALVSALAFLRCVGRAHGAIKPSNIFASNGGIKITDPWIGSGARPRELAEEDIRFSAPEVLGGAEPTLDSDLYSLGALLYRFFSGRDPFEDSDPESLKAKYIWAAPRPLSSVSHVSRTIAEIVTHLLDKDPTRREGAFESLKNEFDEEAKPASRGPVVGMSSSIATALGYLSNKRGLNVVLVEGPVGSGKSRFVEELRSRVLFGDRPVAVCEVVAPDPYLNLARKLIALVDEHAIEAGASSLSRVAEFVAFAQEPVSKSAEEGMNRDLISVLTSVCRRLPLLLIIEDIDRSGKRLLSLLELMAQRPGDFDLSAVVTSRPYGAPARNVSALRKDLGESFCRLFLSLLSYDESKALSCFLSTDDEARVSSQQRAGGSPALLEEFCRDSSRAILPKRARNIFNDLMARLPTRQRRVAEALSVFEDATTWDALSQVSGMSERDLRVSIAQLERIGLVLSGGLAIRYKDAAGLLQSRIPKSRRIELHATCFRYLQQTGSNHRALSHHAFHGGLFKVAGDLYRQSARESFAAKDFVTAGRYYAFLSECCTRDPELPSFDPADSIRQAKCYLYQGNREQSRSILMKLLDSNEVHASAELRSSIYATLASPLMENSAQGRIRLLGMSIDCLNPDSLQLVHRYRALTIAHLSAGNSLEAEKALSKIAACSGVREDLQLEDVRASVLMNQGNFRDAAKCLMSRKFLWASPGSVSNNLAVCIEQLGDLNKARELQASALREASSSGNLYPQVCSLANLGAMETKLGNLEAAEDYFRRLVTRLRELQRRDGKSGIAKFTSTYSDLATLMIQKGEYRSAGSYLARVNMKCAGPFPLELFFIALARCELYLELNQSQKARAVLLETKNLPLRGEFFDVERLLIEERFLKSTPDLCDRLERALASCERLGTLYQTCRLQIALAKHSLVLGDPQKANIAAHTARRLSTENGYRPLSARALLFLGLSTSQTDEKEFALRSSIEAATELGMAPMLAECTYRMGHWRFSRGDYWGAQEYLSKSMSITARLGDDLGRKDRDTYLSHVQYREARSLFNEALAKAVSSPPRLAELIDGESNLFAKIYRLVAALAASADFGQAIDALVRTLKGAMDQSIVVISETGAKPVYTPVRGSVSDEMRKRIASIGAMTGRNAYISGLKTGHVQTSMVWIPILSLALPGGIYVESSSDNAPPNEREIEFLTVVAAVASAAFDRICSSPSVGLFSSAQPFGLIGSSLPMKEVRSRIEIAATNSATVLIEGESGTGKELVAKAIHENSNRRKEPFVAVDCGALPEGLIEAELFGANKGAYTGALNDRQGLFESANRGTIFLDEISNLGLVAQAKLLRVLQEREIRRIGSMTGKRVDVRLIAATNCNLERLVRDGKFRQDLLYRLKVLHVFLPPLRNRKEDLPALAATFLERLNGAGRVKKFLAPRVLERLSDHDYPGNVRELQNVIDRAFYSTNGTVIGELEFFHGGRSIDTPAHTETESWFNNLADGRENFWSDVYDRYKRRDISRERVVALVDFGLRKTRGRYKTIASMWQIRKDEYHRFMDFLRRSECLLDFRPYRKSTEVD